MKSSSRRKFLHTLGRKTWLFVGGTAVIYACAGKEKQQEAYDGDPCEDLRGISEAELDKRKNFGYVSESPIADNQCSNCNLYLPPKEAQACGKCILFEGPVQAQGYCTYWALKVNTT